MVYVVLIDELPLLNAIVLKTKDILILIEQKGVVLIEL
jgi:hypothetical protein